MAGKQMVMLVLATVVLAAFFGVSSAKTITVGGSTGWTIPSSPSFYSSWASKQSFQVGDTLVFTFPASVHTVAEVSKANFDSCNVGNTVGPVLATAPASITLKTPGTHYFVCTVTGHCGANQKLAVTVAGSKAATPVPSPKKTPSPSASPSPSPAATPASSPAATPASSPAPTPTTSSPAATPAATPSASASPPMPTTAGPSADTPAGSATGPSAASGPSGAGTPPAGSFAASTGVSLLSLVSIVVAALAF